MATLIAVYSTQGCLGRCDARCYQATTPRCTCICGGANHAAGHPQALANTRQHAKRWIEHARATGWRFQRTHLGVHPGSDPLF